MRISKFKKYTTPIFLIAFLSLASLPAISQSTSDDQTKTVISEGIGKDVPSALQNAAQNALINVVGSFVDATKLLEKRVEIQKGIRSETSSIDTNIKEYSQGSIKGVELIDASEQSGLVKVTAKISVRDETFKTYINKIAAGEQDFSGENLFLQSAAQTASFSAQLAIAEKQDKNKLALMTDMIENIVNGVKFEVRAPKLIDNIEIYRYYDKALQKMIKKYGKENIYVSNASSSLDSELIKEINKILELISEKKRGTIHYDFGRMYLKPLSEENSNDVLLSIVKITKFGKNNCESNSDYKNYSYPNEIFLIKDTAKQIYSKIKNKNLAKNLAVEIIDEKDNVLKKEILYSYGIVKDVNKFRDEIWENAVYMGNQIIAVLAPNNFEPCNDFIGSPEWMNLDIGIYNSLHLAIYEKKPFDIIMAIEPDVIAKAKKIRINLTDEI